MVLCAAVKFHIDITDKDVIVPCRRHCDAYCLLKDMGFSPQDGYSHEEDGFITTTGEFLTRNEAYNEAIECGQLPYNVRLNINNGLLLSEDLY